MAQSIGSALQENNPDLFTALDSDEDGSLSASELRSAMEAMRPDTTSTDAAQEDGSALFSALDTNQDGTISSEELQAGRDAMRQAMQDSGVGPPPPPSDDLTSSSGQEQFQANLMNEILRSLFADSTAS